MATGALFLLSLVPLPAMAAPQPDYLLDEPQEAAASDPFEPINRRIFAFNVLVNDYGLEPLFRTYEGLVPGEVRSIVFNVIDNLRAPWSVVGSAAAADLETSAFYLRRFAINSTFGLLGALDVAAEVGLPRRDSFTGSDLFCAYGLPPGPYLMLPLLGPANARSAAGRVLDYSAAATVLGDYYTTYLGTTTFNQLYRARETALSGEAGLLDPYAALRSVFQQYDTTCGSPK